MGKLAVIGQLVFGAAWDESIRAIII